MQHPNALSVIDGDGTFRDDTAARTASDRLDNLLDQRDSGRISGANYLAELKRLVEGYPYYLDGYAHLGGALLNQGKPKLALEQYLSGFRLGEAGIPADFSGTIFWSSYANRPFLRCAQGLVSCFIRLRRHAKALELMKRMLQWDPSDALGMRFLIGSEYLRQGREKEALEIFEREAPAYPPYHFELGLLKFIAGDTVAAATSLRRGFVANVYIAEMLCGMSDPVPLVIWQGSTLHEPSTAVDYVSAYRRIWEYPGALHFLRWLHTHPRIMRERADILAFDEALVWEHDFQKRRSLVSRRHAAYESIDDRLSSELVRRRESRNIGLVDPWYYPLYKRP